MLLEILMPRINIAKSINTEHQKPAKLFFKWKLLKSNFDCTTYANYAAKLLMLD